LEGSTGKGMEIQPRNLKGMDLVVWWLDFQFSRCAPMFSKGPLEFPPSNSSPPQDFSLWFSNFLFRLVFFTIVRSLMLVWELGIFFENTVQTVFLKNSIFFVKFNIFCMFWCADVKNLISYLKNNRNHTTKQTYKACTQVLKTALYKFVKLLAPLSLPLMFLCFLRKFIRLNYSMHEMLIN